MAVEIVFLFVARELVLGGLFCLVFSLITVYGNKSISTRKIEATCG